MTTYKHADGTYRSADGNTIAGPGGAIIKNYPAMEWSNDLNEWIPAWTPPTTCAFCDAKATPNGLCDRHNREDQEIQRRNDASKPRPRWEQQIDAGPEARHDW